ncbi:MAG TPA: hypothetical protein ENN23_02005 [Deltaproteobacteria bacterium]|nr:hypothetical protein [Deltaproteobacteria bacterium]
MNKLEESLNKIADIILHLDEASLNSLWEKYKDKAHDFSLSPEWEKAFIIFSIINSIRLKNEVFNEQILQQNNTEKPAPSGTRAEKPNLKLVK